MTATAAAPVPPGGGRVETSGEGGPDAFVLHSRALRPGTDLAVTSRFIDPVWRLDPAQPQRHRVAMTLNFSPLPPCYHVTAKQLCYAQLSGPLPPGERRPKVATVARTLSDLVLFLRWLDDHDKEPVDGLTATDLLNYQRHLLVSTRASRTRHRVRGAVRMLWRYRDSLDHPLRFDPRHLDEWGEPHRGAAVENATDRIPEPVLGPLIGWAIRFVDEFAPDILAANRRWQQLRQGERRTTRRPRGAARPRLDALLDGYREQNRPLPSRDGHPNCSYLSVLAGCGETGLFRFRDEIDAAVAELGLDGGSPIDTPITATIDGRAWLTAILTDHRRAEGLGQLTRQLRAACYVLIAYLSGMRDSEIKHLHRGCLRIDRDRRDVAYRWTVTSLAFKGEDDPVGVEATWGIGHPAARAITVLEQLQPPTTELLFTALPSVGAGQAARAGNDALSSTTTCAQLNSFVGWVNGYCADRGRARPDTPGQPEGLEAHDQPVPPHPGLVHRATAGRGDRRRDPVPPPRHSDVRGLRRHVGLRVPRRGRVRTSPRPRRAPAHHDRPARTHEPDRPGRHRRRPPARTVRAGSTLRRISGHRPAAAAPAPAPR
jgi:hypothetical protein